MSSATDRCSRWRYSRWRTDHESDRGFSDDRGGGAPGGELGAAIDKAFGSFEKFKEQFNAKGAGNFGSGWTWLVKDGKGAVSIVNTDDAGNPLRDGHTPLMTVDVWEHAYYIDKRNARPSYIESWWNVVDWNVAAKNFG